MIPASRNCASSTATTWASSRRFCEIWSDESTGIASTTAPVVARDREDAAVAIIEMRLEYLHALLRDDGPAHAANELLALAAEHDTGDDLHPSSPSPEKNRVHRRLRGTARARRPVAARRVASGARRGTIPSRRLDHRDRCGARSRARRGPTSSAPVASHAPNARSADSCLALPVRCARHDPCGSPACRCRRAS